MNPFRASGHAPWTLAAVTLIASHCHAQPFGPVDHDRPEGRWVWSHEETTLVVLLRPDGQFAIAGSDYYYDDADITSWHAGSWTRQDGQIVFAIRESRSGPADGEPTTASWDGADALTMTFEGREVTLMRAAPHPLGGTWIGQDDHGQPVQVHIADSGSPEAPSMLVVQGADSQDGAAWLPRTPGDKFHFHLDYSEPVTVRMVSDGHDMVFEADLPAVERARLRRDRADLLLGAWAVGTGDRQSHHHLDFDPDGTLRITTPDGVSTGWWAWLAPWRLLIEQGRGPNADAQIVIVSFDPGPEVVLHGRDGGENIHLVRRGLPAARAGALAPEIADPGAEGAGITELDVPVTSAAIAGVWLSGTGETTERLHLLSSGTFVRVRGPGGADRAWTVGRWRLTDGMITLEPRHTQDGDAGGSRPITVERLTESGLVLSEPGESDIAWLRLAESPLTGVWQGSTPGGRALTLYMAAPASRGGPGLFAGFENNEPWPEPGAGSWRLDADAIALASEDEQDAWSQVQIARRSDHELRLSIEGRSVHLVRVAPDWVTGAWAPIVDPQTGQTGQPAIAFEPGGRLWVWDDAVGVAPGPGQWAWIGRDAALLIPESGPPAIVRLRPISRYGLGVYAADGTPRLELWRPGIHRPPPPP